ncbi:MULTISPECIES: hypothetical protein [Photorhabdus]|uniref:Homocitrate synthase n=1 Tax=Photorhabdus khanii subsp. guanajuatensis TaxID=2100166 RepID=A0A4V2X863_9GAMM|nr:hypothetical protein [Photorhabdus khanii]TDB58635.1 hypothetical protein C5467_10040 [Photorhabdus khanii subsp. guanajuatensis]
MVDSHNKCNIVNLADTTLRDGEQALGVVFSKETKVSIFNSLVDAGVEWIEAGIPAMKGDEVLALEEMLERKNEVNIIGWNREILEDIKYTFSLGFKAIHIGLPTSNIHLKHSVSTLLAVDIPMVVAPAFGRIFIHHPNKCWRLSAQVDDSITF